MKSGMNLTNRLEIGLVVFSLFMTSVDIQFK
jgi:hypothetical protein